MDNERKLLFKIVFKPQWVLTKRGEKLPSDRISEEITKVFEVGKLTKAMSECEGIITVSEDKELGEVKDEICAIINGLYDDAADSFSITVADAAAELGVDFEEIDTETEEKKPEEKSAPAETAAASETVGGIPKSILGGTSSSAEKPSGKPVIEEIDALVGAEEFKALCHEVSDVAEALKKYDVVDSFVFRNYLIAINDGYGLTTYLQLFGRLVTELGLIKLQTSKEIVEIKIPNTGDVNDFKEAKSSLSYGMNGGKIICFDISDWINKTTDVGFRTFLKAVNDVTGYHIVFFRVPFLERNVVDRLHDNINDQIFLKDIAIVPFSMEQLDQVADRILAGKGFTMDETARDLYHTRIVEEKSDGRFYGVNTVRKIVNEMLYDKQISGVANGEFNTEIKAEDIAGLTSGESNSELTGTEMLDQMVGIDSIKEQMFAIIAQIEAALANDSLEKPCIHMRFVGNPGTGKTTIARIFGRILAEKQVLRVGSLFEIGGRDLCGRYVGQTAPRTAAICRDAYGSVLFIDEAYSLFSSDRPDDVDYGKEAVDTLIAEMENHRSDFLVIMAGYPDEMERLMTINVGLRQRMPYTIEFPNYTREQLAEIFLSMCRKSFAVGEDFVEAAKDYFIKLSDDYFNSKQFSNGRFCRNLYERTWGKAVLRCQMAGIPCKELVVEDLALAAQDKDFASIIGKKTTKIGFA